MKPALKILSSLLLCAGLITQSHALEISVRPDKLRVKPGEPVMLDVAVKGLAPGQTADVDCQVIRGVDETAATFTAKTDASGKVQFSFTPKAEWSYGAHVTAKAGTETASASDVFTVAESAYAVAVDYNVPAVYGPDVLPDGSAAPEGPVQNPVRKQQIASEVARFRQLYLTVGELMGVSFCSFSSIKPPVPNYFKGFHYNYSTNAVRALIDELHRNGISSVMYVNGCLSGLAGTDFARRHPEYLAYTPDGMPFNGGVDLSTMDAHLDYVANYPESLKRTAKDKDFEKKLKGPYPGFINAWLDFRDPRVSEIGAEKILEGQAYFGYDGVRYDGEYRVPSIGDPMAPSRDFRNYKGEKQAVGKEAEELTTRNMRIALETMRKKYPGFLLGLNNADYRSDGMGNRALTSGYGKLIAGGTWILDEVAKGSSSVTSPTHLWSNFIREMSAQADRTRRAGNYLFAGWGGGPGKKITDTKQIKAISWASGLSWICGSYKMDAPLLEVRSAYNRFCLRYIEFILNNRLERIPQEKAKTLAQVSASRPVFWDRFVQTLKADGKNHLVFHLINQPLEEGVTVEAQEPPPAENVAIQFAAELLPGAPKSAKAWILSPDPGVEPQAIELQSKNGKFSLNVPSLKIWNLVVVRAE